MIILSVRKGGTDPNEFAPCVLIQLPDQTWRPADPRRDIIQPVAALFHGYNCANDGMKDDAVDAARAIDSVWKQLFMRYLPVCCLWPGLGESWLERIRFHQAIRNARQSAVLYAEFFSCVETQFMLVGHSLGCGLTGFMLDRLTRPADLTVWMGAAVPQYATAAVDPHRQNNDWIGKFGVNEVFDFHDGLRRNTKRLVNFYGDDPVLEGAFERCVNEKACGRHGSWPGPERLPNVIDIDVRRTIKKHGHYRHDLLNVWHPVREHARVA